MKNLHLALVTLIFLACCNRSQEDSQTEVQANNEESTSISNPTENKLVGNELRNFDEFTQPNDFLNGMIFKRIDVISSDFDRDQIIDSIELYEIDSLVLKEGETVLADDAGDYMFIVIDLSRLNKRDTFLVADGVKKQFLLDTRFDQEQKPANEYISYYPSGLNNLLIMEGYTYGNGESSQMIINIYDGIPELIFNADQRIRSIRTNENGITQVTIIQKKGDEYIGDSVTYNVNKWLEH